VIAARDSESLQSALGRIGWKIAIGRGDIPARRKRTLTEALLGGVLLFFHWAARQDRECIDRAFMASMRFTPRMVAVLPPIELHADVAHLAANLPSG